MNTIHIVDSILTELATAKVRADHVAAMIADKTIRKIMIHRNGELTDIRLEMSHTDFIAYLNEQAL